MSSEGANTEDKENTKIQNEETNYLSQSQLTVRHFWMKTSAKYKMAIWEMLSSNVLVSNISYILSNAAAHLSRLPLIHSNLEDEPEEVRRAFNRYLGSIVTTLSESREREEMSIIT